MMTERPRAGASPAGKAAAYPWSAKGSPAAPASSDSSGEPSVEPLSATSTSAATPCVAHTSMAWRTQLATVRASFRQGRSTVSSTSGAPPFGSSDKSGPPADRNEFVVDEESSQRAWKRERILGHGCEAGLPEHGAERREIHERHMRRVAEKPLLLRRECEDAPPRLEQGGLRAPKVGGLGRGQVLEHVREEKRVESTRSIERGLGKFLGEEGLQPAVPRDGDRVPSSFHAHALESQVSQVPTDATADLERETRLQPQKIPAIGRLHVEGALPPCALMAHEPSRVLEVVHHRGDPALAGSAIDRPGLRSLALTRARSRSTIRESRR